MTPDSLQMFSKNLKINLTFIYPLLTESFLSGKYFIAQEYAKLPFTHWNSLILLVIWKEPFVITKQTS